MKDTIYLDYGATTPIDERVLEKMLPFLKENYGNASNTLHSYGRVASNAIEHARLQIANAIGAGAQEIIFTSGATESINIVLRGIFTKYESKGKHYVTCQTEHPAVRKTLKYLESFGAEVTYLEVDENGAIDLDEFKAVLREDTVLASFMGVNNETGVVHPIKALSAIAKEAGVLMMTDGTQSIGKIDCHLDEIGVDILVGSAHKVYGPKGIGFIYAKRRDPRVLFDPLMHGGSQEDNKRSGTYNVPAIVGMGEAIKIIMEEGEAIDARIQEISDSFKKNLKEQISCQIIETENQVPHIVNVSFNDASSSFVKELSKNVAISVGAACSSAANKGSHVLQSMGLDEDRIKKSIRFCIGRNTTNEDLEQVLTHIKTSLKD